MTTDPVLTLTDIHKSYKAPDGPELPVLKGVHLTVARGESLAIMGPSGCGKSTLLNIIGTLDHPDKGEVTFDGRPLQGMSDKTSAEFRNREIGFIFQMHHLLPQCTALDNVLMPALAAGTSTQTDCIDRARSLLSRVGLQDRLHYRPGQLSGGECQRVAVVRALINRPTLLLADEPTGALDQTNADDLMALLMELQNDEGLTMIMVTHSRAVAQTANRQLELSAGIITD